MSVTYDNLKRILDSTNKSVHLADDRKRTMRFPSRPDYIQQLEKHQLIADESAFINDDCLTKAVYLDWLRRPQVGCIFAQLLARPANRFGMRTVVARGSSGNGKPKELAAQIDNLVEESIRDASDEAITVLLPHILTFEVLARLIWELSELPSWHIEIERRWRRTVFLIGLRVKIAKNVYAETLGMGPFAIFPSTRQCPVTTLEIRTKTKRAKRSRLFRNRRAAHLAAISVDGMLTTDGFKYRFKRLTPRLRRRALGGENDKRAKARVTYSIPAAIWSDLKANAS